VAHCNFQLRGDESDKDEQLVQELAVKIKSKFYVNNFDTKSYANKNKVSIQMAARELRYDWFEQIMEKYGYKTLITAHHADDDLETFLINLSRGTGLEGLTGIPEKTNTISRPLLAFSRGQILKYAKEQKLQWREDESNTDSKYLRNKIRKEVVPPLKELNPVFLENFKQTLNHLKGSASILNESIAQIKSVLFEEKDNVTHISIAALKKLNPVEPYIYELFRDYGFTAWQDIKKLIDGDSGKEVHSKTHRLLKNREELLLQTIENSTQASFYLSEEVKSLNFPLELTVNEVDNYEKANNPNILFVDKKTLKYPLVLRKWRKGDYFYPMGMKGRKKVSKFFKDEKMDIFSKERQWLLFSNDKLIWVIGKRGDERFKVTEKTNAILELKLHL